MYSKTAQIKKVKIKTVRVQSIAQLKKRVQRVVNLYIRKRDENEPCISCGRKGELDAGHYVAQGSSGWLRFNEFNLNGQCVSCNRFKHGNLINYRIGLVNKYGEAVVVGLEENRNQVKKWTREELLEIEQYFKEKLAS